MHEWQSQAHVRWDCKYHVVIVPKCRRKLLYGKLRRQIGAILRDLCNQKRIELIEGRPSQITCTCVWPSREVQRGLYDWVPEGQKCHPHPSAV